MRLLRIRSNGELALVERGDGELLKYAILSHTWLPDSQEVTFEELRSPINDRTKAKLGYRKLVLCSKQAKIDDLHFVWADTCCINKASSAELSEAINSMYRWYRKATKCYAYLSDISIDASRSGEGQYLHSQLKKSRWFTRGWTLQELIAPTQVAFYDQGWSHIGTKQDLVGPLSDITGIDSLVLGDQCNLHELSVAKRLSWAARRETTRVEDRAYCLLGLLDINMTLIYGEGEKAFMRLQDELLRISDDCSLFSWGRSMDTGILAPSPSHFEPCGKIVPVEDSRVSNSWQMTHRGLRLTLPILSQDDHETSLGVLACRSEDQYTHVLALHLRKHGQDNSSEPPAFLCSVQKCTIECVIPPGCMEGYCGLHFVDIRRLENVRSTTILIPSHNYQTFISFSGLRFTQSVWIRRRPPSLQPLEAFPSRQWNLGTMAMSRYKRIPNQTGDDKQVGAIVFKFDFDPDAQHVLCFAVSYKMQYVEIIRKNKKSLQSICEDLDAATSGWKPSQKVAVHHISSGSTEVSRRVRAHLEEEIVLGEEVWIIDLTLSTDRGKATVFLG